MASIIPHGDRWRAQVAIAGVRDSKVFRTKREATSWAAIKETEIRAEQAKKPAERVTLHNLLARYIEEISPQKRGAEKEIIRLKAMTRMLPNLALSDVGPEVIQRYRDERLQQVKPNSVLRELGTLSSVFEHAIIEWRFLSANPVRMIRKPPRGEHRDRLISLLEIRAMLRQMGYSPRVRINTLSGAIGCCFLMALRTGMRAGELCDLSWGNVFPTHVHVGEITRKTDAAERDVPIIHKTRRLLQKMRGFDPAQVFGLKAGSLDAMFRKYRERAGLDGFTFHDSRHNAATWMVKYGSLNVLELCKIMGWTNPKQAMVYFNPSPEDLARRLHVRR